MIQSDFNWYKANGCPETVIAKAKEITARVSDYYGVVFNRLFISNTKDESHEDYTSLWLFSDEYVVECKNFLIRMDIDLAKYKGNVKYVNVVSDNFDSLDNISPDSSMRLTVSISNDLKCAFEAVGANCVKMDELSKFFVNEFKGL